MVPSARYLFGQQPYVDYSPASRKGKQQDAQGSGVAAAKTALHVTSGGDISCREHPLAR